MHRLTDSQYKLLLDILDGEGWYNIHHLYYKFPSSIYTTDEKRSEIVSNVNFLKSLGMIETTSDNYEVDDSFARLLPNGVLYVCIETEFIDITPWATLVNNRLDKKDSIRSSAEREAYYFLCLNLIKLRKKYAKLK